MGVNGRRSNYTLLSQIPDEQHHQQPPAKVAAVAAQYYESQIMGKSDRGFDWELVDQRVVPPQSRMGATAFSGTIGSQRHSSGSSFGESSISGDYYVPSLSNPDGFVQLHDDGGVELLLNTAEGGGGGGSSSTKSWAQQTEESYQLQLALALRLSSEATCADDPNFLDPVTDESMARSSSSSASAEAMSHRFWVKGSLSYLDKVPDGFYLIHGIDPCIWSVCVDFEENGRIPSIESLKNLDPGAESSIEVILIDRFSDPSLKELQNRIHTLSCSCITLNEVVDHLAKLVCSHMGGVSHIGEDHLIPNWKECTDELKDCLRSVVLLIGSLPIGLCRHRALLFKVLADTIGLPCRIAKGCKYCTRDDASSCVVRFGFDREYMVDLIGNPGCLCEPDSLLNGPSSISISSPLCFPRLRQVEPPIDFRSLAKQYFADSLSLNLVFDDSSAGDVQHQHLLPGTSGNNDVSHSALLPLNAWQEGFNRDSPKSDFSRNIPPIGHTDDVQQSLPSNDLRFGMEDLDIPWSDLVLKEGIGVGSFGNVHRADWNGCDVAVKILMEQDFHEERVNEFLREVAIMKRLRHPNIVLFMGAVTQPPNLSIVTEYLSRGSLFKLLHKPGGREVLDERRRLLMAYDVAKGMNYLHKHNPPIVHRDLKSPNLLVDKKYTVKVCDFGLSRLKANTYLSSKSLAGTPEWMAPEVLRNEQSNEKSDVYSFGVILWELVTMQQPWRNLNAAQVVAAVGFQYKRLEIPKDLNPKVAAIIEACFANEPWKRPSFASIMESLRPLTKVPTPLSMPSLT